MYIHIPNIRVNLWLLTLATPLVVKLSLELQLSINRGEDDYIPELHLVKLPKVHPCLYFDYEYLKFYPLRRIPQEAISLRADL